MAAVETPPTPEYSVVIPVFNAAGHVERTLDACVRFFERGGRSFELVLVDDGSGDESWDVLRRRALADRRLVSVGLLRNYGQHTAVWCGLKHVRGRRVVTLDDDLQNPPEEIERLITAADAGADAVFGRPERKRHGLLRRLGSRLVDRINSRVFGKPRRLVLTNFRLLDRAVVERMLAHPTDLPYVNGIAWLHARRPVNVTVQHRPRQLGRSGYAPGRALALAARILFGYSAAPLRAVSTVGLAASAVAFALAIYFLGRALFVGTSVPGWASVIVVLSFLNALTLLLLGMLGEYTVRIVRHLNRWDAYHVLEQVDRRDGPDA